MAFDYIIIGAGAAGCPLAARLSEDPSRKVLLIEAGPDCATTEAFPADLLDARLMTGGMPGHPNNWAFLANLTPDLPYSVARGKVLGGSTALNGTYFIRARRSDFDRWAAAGNPEWTYDKVLPFYRRLERDLSYGETELHGGAGPVPVFRQTERPHPLTSAFFEACRELGFTEEADKNGEQAPGYGPLTVNATDGRRVNTGLAYINPHRDRRNLTVIGDTLARRVLFEGKRATGVEVERSGRRTMFELTAGGEVVLSAGAIKSPHLLALSGIGPRADLERQGIPVLSDLAGVGQGFSDHADVLLAWRPRKVPGGEPDNIFEAVLNFTAAGSPFDGDLEVLPSVRTLGQMMGMSSGGLGGVGAVARRPIATLKGLRGVSVRRLSQQARQLQNLFFSISVQCPESRGTITLVDDDPTVAPKIDYHYLSTESDLRRLREAVRVSARILQSRAFRPYFADLSEIDGATLADGDRLDAWLRTHLATAIHASGSARMGPASDPQAVVDQFGRVRGVHGLRVADTSILPTVPSRGPAATAVMIGERIADFIATGADAPDPAEPARA